MQTHIFISRTWCKDRVLAQKQIVSKFLCPVFFGGADRLKLFCPRCGKILVAGQLSPDLSPDLLRVHLYDQHLFCPLIHSRIKNTTLNTFPVPLGHAELCPNNNENSHLEEFYYSTRWFFDYRSQCAGQLGGFCMALVLHSASSSSHINWTLWCKRGVTQKTEKNFVLLFAISWFLIYIYLSF
jgi:hypothetical protein